jgi:hypothetical protein
MGMSIIFPHSKRMQIELIKNLGQVCFKSLMKLSL